MGGNYWEWVREQARVVESDGCTRVFDVNVQCCYEHDLAYRTHRDPRLAYVRGWQAAPPISKGEADRRFYKCNANFSEKWGWLGTVWSWVRWAGVDRFGDFDDRPQEWLDRLGAKSSPSPDGVGE